MKESVNAGYWGLAIGGTAQTKVVELYMMIHTMQCATNTSSLKCQQILLTEILCLQHFQTMSSLDPTWPLNSVTNYRDYPPIKCFQRYQFKVPTTFSCWSSGTLPFLRYHINKPRHHICTHTIAMRWIPCLPLAGNKK